MLLRVLSRTPSTDATSQLPDKAVGFELVWIAPLSPCHGVVQSPTFRDAPIDYGDLVLWDGRSGRGARTSDEESVQVFPLLEILRPGDGADGPSLRSNGSQMPFRTSRKALPEGVRVFIQQERVEHHCTACEAGRAARARARGGRGRRHASVSVQRQRMPRCLWFVEVIVPFALNTSEFREAWQSAAKAEHGGVGFARSTKRSGIPNRQGRSIRPGAKGRLSRHRARP